MNYVRMGRCVSGRLRNQVTAMDYYQLSTHPPSKMKRPHHKPSIRLSINHDPTFVVAGCTSSPSQGQRQGSPLEMR